MSGGVDSSVAAALLVDQGYDVTGMFAVNYDANLTTKRESTNNVNESCWRGDYQDALRVAAKLGIPLLRWDFTRPYKRDVLDYMYREYRAGRTPNPDVLCNKFIKFGAWIDRAKKERFDYIATGHYARLRRKIRNSKSEILNLMQAKDKNKDQTYFLHQLSQEQLKQAIFPIGDFIKPEVRRLAKKFKLPNADKEESMGICFVGEVPMKKFLQKEIKPNPGRIISTGGEFLGEHTGLPFYTIGERIGINSKPYFIINKIQKTNELIVGGENDPALFKKEITISDINWISGQPSEFPLKCKVRLRHRQPLQACVVSYHPERGVAQSKDLIVKFSTPQRAVTPGQFAVFYKGQECLGGGVIY